MVKKYKVKEIKKFISKALNWAGQFSHFSYLNNNNIPYPFGTFPNCLAANAKTILHHSDNSFENLKKFHNEKRDWLFGYFTYDLKNKIEELTSKHPDRAGYDPVCFFQPEHLLFFKNDYVEVYSNDTGAVMEQIHSTGPIDVNSGNQARPVNIQSQIGKKAYLEKVEKIRQHIIEGDVYELNLCMEFYAGHANINPIITYLKLNEASPMPFSMLQKIEDKFLICASPERFIKKRGHKLISQPIKGTISRGNTPEEDVLLKKRLRYDKKELAENMMIADLVRNDLAKSAIAGTVRPEELFGIYTFRHMHQMISTISATMKDGIHFIDAIKNAFPMGSMTGAPKIKAMELIEKYEESKRGLYSGAAGFITPNGDFDFNVVIRSILYNSSSKVLSFQVGSAITYDSIPEKEYEECLLKAKAMKEVLGLSLTFKV